MFESYKIILTHKKENPTKDYLAQIETIKKCINDVTESFEEFTNIRNPKRRSSYKAKYQEKITDLIIECVSSLRYQETREQILINMEKRKHKKLK